MFEVGEVKNILMGYGGGGGGDGDVALWLCCCCGELVLDCRRMRVDGSLR